MADSQTKRRVYIREVQKGYIDVFAETAEEAQKMYLDEYNEGNVTWTDSSITDVSGGEEI